ncbi:hypothetical protein ACFSX5_03905 [Devosia albogilva]|uniref:Uncharacterized protein n=1 Tax=Devosia albogilva TaxID=429726 RepID=A0ABW5QGU4_9HYPH
MNWSHPIGLAPHNWMQHHLPWLVVLTMVIGLFRDEPVLSDERDELNG